MIFGKDRENDYTHYNIRVNILNSIYKQFKV